MTNSNYSTVHAQSYEHTARVYEVLRGAIKYHRGVLCVCFCVSKCVYVSVVVLV